MLIVVVIVVVFVLPMILYVMVLGFGGTSSMTPAATFAKSPVTDGWRVSIVSITRMDVPWDDIRVQLNDGTNFAEWGTMRAGLDVGYMVTVPYGTEFLDTLSVTLTVTDVAGNGFVSGSDYFTVTATSFGSGTVYWAALIYEPTGERIGTGITFTG